MIARILLLVCLLSALPLAGARAAEKKQDEDSDQKRSAIVEVEGVVMLDENQTIKKIREMAYMQARRKAARSALTHVKSYTQMKNFQVTDDLVESYADARIRILEDKDIGIQNNRYKVWIRAEVSYDERAEPPKPPAPQTVKAEPEKKPAKVQTVSATPETPTQPAKVPLTVRIWTAKRDYKKGDKVKVFVAGNRDFYGQIFYEDANGTIIRLLPNDYRREHFFKAGVTYQVPDGDDRFELTVTPPFGAERLTVYASTKPTADLDGKDIGGGLKMAVKGGNNVDDTQRRKNRDKLALNMRALTVAPTDRGKPSAPTEFFEAVWRIHTEKN